MPHDRGSHDYDLVAFVFLQVALGARAIRYGLDLAVCGTRHRRKSSGLLSESRIFLRCPMVAGATRRTGRWPSAYIFFKIAVS